MQSASSNMDKQESTVAVLQISLVVSLVNNSLIFFRAFYTATYKIEIYFARKLTNTEISIEYFILFLLFQSCIYQNNY